MNIVATAVQQHLGSAVMEASELAMSANSLTLVQQELPLFSCYSFINFSTF
jgi:hypothetical protein